MRKKIFLLCLFFVLTALAGCAETEQVDKSRIYSIFTVNKDETKIASSEYVIQTTEKNAQIEELLDQLAVTPEKLDCRAPLGGNFQLLNYTVEEGQLNSVEASQLILNFDEHYLEQSVTTEVLVRAAIVRTMTQIQGVDYVSFQVRSNPLTDSAGNIIGTMSKDMFIDNAESEINAKEQVKLRLYFANEEGNKLIETNRTLEYSTNISIEKLVVEQLISGPSELVKGKVFPIINPDTKVVGVTVKDGTCYVNLSENFLTQIYNVTSEVTIYSIANSLVELPNVNRVQIAIDGNTNIMYRENLSLAVTYERNLDMVTLAD